MSVVRTDGRAGGRSVYGHVITKFSRMGSLPHFFTHGAPLRASRARAPLLRFVTEYMEASHSKIFFNDFVSKYFSVSASAEPFLPCNGEAVFVGLRISPGFIHETVKFQK